MKRDHAGLLLVGCLTACWGSPDGPQTAGRLEVHWTGPDTGQMSAPASAEWCPDRRSLEIRAVYGDTGFAMVLYPLDTVDTDTYRVVTPAGADSLAPSAAVALRLFSANAIRGYQGDSGSVALERSGSGELSGTVAARSRSVVNNEVLRMTGRFGTVVVKPQKRGCSPESAVDSVAAESEPGDTLDPDIPEDVD